MDQNNESPQRISLVPGLAVLCCFVTGIIAIVVALVETAAALGTGVCLLAAAVAFGLVAVACFSH